MKVQVHSRFTPGLPEHDDHPYRSAAWRPQRVEYDAWDLEVEGEVPRDLAGVYLRNTENPLFEPIKRYHPFDGDGMLHSISFEDGRTRYANRFVRTDGFLAEQEARQSLWAGIAEHPSNAIAERGWGARTLLKDTASTDVIVHGGYALASFYQCGELYRLDPLSLKDCGKSTWNGAFPREGVSAHPKVDEHTAELLFFNYGQEAPYMHYGVVDRAGQLVHYLDVPLPGPRLPHDMAFTERFVVLNDLPLYWDPEALAAGYYSNRFYRDQPSRFAIIPRLGTKEQIRWFEADPTFVLHFANAYEEGNKVVLDGYFQHNPTARGVERADARHKGFETLDVNVLEARAHRWVFDLETGKTTETPLSENCAEFPMVNGRHAGRRHRYMYSARCCHGLFAFDGLYKHDVDSGTEILYEAPEGVFISETAMAPRLGSTAEDDGYLLTFASDLNADRSECLIFEASDPAQGPVARVRLPERISSGTHATWAPRSDL